MRSCVCQVSTIIYALEVSDSVVFADKLCGNIRVHSREILKSSDPQVAKKIATYG